MENFLSFNKVKPFKFIETNIKALDKLLGGGLPKGRLIELAGETDTGKTKLLFDIIEHLKEEELIVAYIATSNKSLGYLKQRGLDNNEKLLLISSNSESNIISFIKNTINVVDLYILDSVPEILTENEKIGFDLNVHQDVPSILKSINSALYGSSSSLLAVNHLIYKNEENVSRWENLFKKYCSIRLLMNNDNIKLISHKLNPYIVGGEINGLHLGK